MPLGSFWLTIAEYRYEAKELLEIVIKDGLGHLQLIFKRHDMARMLMDQEAYTLNELEQRFVLGSVNWFKNEQGCQNAIEVWNITKEVSETIRRVGKDNLETVDGVTYSAVFMKGYLVKDPYLNSFLPKPTPYSHNSYGWVPGSDPEITYKVEKNESLTEKIKANYDAIYHYQMLIRDQLRRIKSEEDHAIFLTAVSER